MPKKSCSSSEPISRPPDENSEPSKSTPWKEACEPIASNLPRVSCSEARSSRFASSSASSSSPSAIGSISSSVVWRSRAWSRSTSISLASIISCGTDGRKTDAVSPRLRARTKRPIACAKKRGVLVLVAYTPTAKRGTSTPSDTMRTATIHRLLLSRKSSILADASRSSESTTVGFSPVILCSFSA